MVVLFICVGDSPFSTSHTYTPLSSTVTPFIVRLLLESSSQLSHAVGTEFVIEIGIKKVRSVSSAPFLFSHMILGAGNPVASQVIVTVADSLTVPPPVTTGELGGTSGQKVGLDRVENKVKKPATKQ